jgi:pimeloyl-ACP methyl ester carboxylesterase
MSAGLVICAAHPTALFPPETAALLSDIAGVPVVCVGPPAGAESLEAVVDAIESERLARGVERWVFWGMSGGSFLGQLYVRQHPQALAGLILASSGPYFRPTVEDPTCILCPQHPAWRDRLEGAGLLAGAVDDGATEWVQVEGVGWVFRRQGGAALLVSPGETSLEMRRMMPALWAFDARGWLPAVRQPVLVMCGGTDPIVPVAHARSLADLFPAAELVLIEGAGHIPLVDHRREVEDAVRGFLRRCVATGDPA